LRSTIEKLVSSLPEDLGLRSCGLPTDENTNEPCPTSHQKQIADERRRKPDNGEEILAQVRDRLCHTCQLFGSPFAAARITLNDLYLINDEWCGTTQIRDGVAIDRDSETAKPGLKYDFEVVPAMTVFGMRLVLENATEEDLQLISIGLSEFVNGFGGVGGLRSRGLGACLLNDLKISCLDLTGEKNQDQMQRLQRYLLYKELAQLDTQSFFEEHINKLFEGSKLNY
jgi:CRISPR-associated RAMP protein (TIGR02581 family)